jgi:hypothetical protein
MKTKSLKKCLLFLVVALSTGVLFISCQKDKSFQFPDPSTLPQGLVGSWVEANTLSDTLIFNSNNNTGIVWLQRGYEIRNGYRLPVIGSTGYEYKIFSDSISMVDGLSSAYNGGNYLFKFDEATLTISVGKFSKYISTKKSVLTFRKIK